MGWREDLATRRDAVAAILAAGETPDGQSLNQMTISVEGESVQVDAYVQRLHAEIERINELIGENDEIVNVISRIVP